MYIYIYLYLYLYLYLIQICVYLVILSSFIVSNLILSTYTVQSLSQYSRYSQIVQTDRDVSFHRRLRRTSARTCWAPCPPSAELRWTMAAPGLPDDAPSRAGP